MNSLRINVTKRGKVYQYKFEIAKINGKRKFINKSGFKTKNEAYIAGIKVYEEYINGGLQKVVHPTYQVWSYQELLKDFNDYIQHNQVILKSVVLLNNYELTPNDDLLNENLMILLKVLVYSEKMINYY